jgi:hypothetical protein
MPLSAFLAEPFIRGARDSRVSLDQRTPVLESGGYSGLEGALDEIVQYDVDLRTLEDEYDLVGGQVDDVPFKSPLAEIEGRTFGDQLGRLLLRSAL